MHSCKLAAVLLGLSLLFSAGLAAQVTYTVTDNTTAGQNPGGLNTQADNTTTGWTQIVAGPQTTNNWSATQTMPFTFEFYGNVVAGFRASSNGLVTFDTVSSALPSANDNLPSVNLPDNTICVFWDDFTGTSSGDDVDIQVFGTAGSQQLWIRWYSFKYGGCSFAYFGVVLEEGTNKIYVMDESYYSGSVTSTVGVQRDNTEATQFGTNTLNWANTSSSSNTNNGWYEFTPIVLVDQLETSGGTSSGLAASGDTNVVAGAFNLFARNAATQDISDITVNMNGSVAPGAVTGLRLWNDQNANGIVDTGEPQIGSTVLALSGTSATFSGSPLLSLSANSGIDLLLTCDVGSGVTSGQTISFEITAGADITTSPGPVVGTFPVSLGSGLTMVTYSSSLPFLENFDGTLAGNLKIVSAAGDYPNSTAVGATPGTGARTAAGIAFRSNIPVGNISPYSGTGFFYETHATGGSCAGVDLFFDLSAYNAASDNLQLRFHWIDDGMDTTSTNTPFNYAFVSVDGGATWLTTLYNLDTSGTTPVWNQAVIDLSAAVNAASSNFTNRVVIRIQASDDSSADALGMDDIILREVQDSLEVGTRPIPGANNGFAVSPTGDVVVLAARLAAQNVNQTVSDITVQNNGSVADADITAIKLWLDNNSDGTLDAGDTQLGTTQTYAGGSATFSGLTLGVNVGTPVDILVTNAFASSATGTAGAAINSAGSITATPGPVLAQFPSTFPVADNIGTLVNYYSSLPYSENFDSTLNTNITTQTAAGNYPTASAVGSTTATGTTGNEGIVSLEGSFLGTTPYSGSTQATFHFDNGQAAAAMDFFFDLSSYNATSDQLEFSFAWNDDGLDASTTLNDPFDYVFISTDGGATWVTAIYYLDPNITTSTTTNAYASVTLNISQLLSAVSANFTSQTVIRIQAADNLSSDCLLIDDVALVYIPPTAPVLGDPTAVASSAPIKITEFDIGATDAIEIQNVGAAQFDATGWQLIVSDSYSVIDTANSITQPLGVMTAGQILTWDDSSSSANYWGNNLYWNPGSYPTYSGWAMIVDPQGNVRDFAALNWLAADIAGMSVTAGGFTGLNPGSGWSGDGINQSVGDWYQRNGTADNNDATDWIIAGSSSIGSTNPGLTIPFPSNAPILQISGTSPSFTATVELGGNLNFNVGATDVNTGDTLTFTVNATGGSLTPAQAGFDQAFTAGVYNDPNPNQAAPHSIDMTGIAQAIGNIQLQIDVSDGTFTSSITLDISIVAGSPLIRTRNIGNMDFFTYAASTPSVFEETFEVAGFNLTADLVVNAPTDFEVSTTSGSGFGASVNLTPNGTIVPFTTIYVRYNPTNAGPHNETISLDSTGANSELIPLTGQIIPATAPVLAAPRAPVADGSVLFTELAQDPGPTADEYIEITNVSSGPVDIAGWTIHIYTGTTPLVSYTMTGTVLQPGATHCFVDVTTNTYVPSAEYLGVNIGSWTNYGLVLVDTNNSIQDVVATGTFDPSTITSPFAIPAAAWSGAGAASPPYTDSVRRSGTQDNNDATDWTLGTGDSLGTTNSGLALPFNIARFIVITGTSPNFSGTAFVGDDLALNFDATDVNTLETLTFTVTVTGGNLTAASAGFNETFTTGVYNDPAPGQSPHSLSLTGAAAQAGTLDLMVEVTDGMFTESFTLSLTISDVPTITNTGTPLLPFFAPATGTPSPEQSYTVAGSALLSDVTINAPAEFEISLTTGTGFGSQLVLTPTAGTLAPTTVFVRYNPSGAGPDSGTLSHTAAYAAAVDETLDGYVGPVPVLSLAGTPLTQFNTPSAGTPSTEQVFNVTGTGVVAPVTVTAPAGFEVSRTSISGFGSSVVLPLVGGNFPTTTVFVRYNPTAGTGTSHSGSISISTPGATSLTVAVDGVIAASSGSSGGGSSDSGGGCVANGSSSSVLWGVLLGALALLMMVSRKRAARD
ncbi:MAG: lamin tail domain-containing protein [Planctomycetes bacterium]|nr:lamin tail domain-containing protein [Planctomycetota bacterium]